MNIWPARYSAACGSGSLPTEATPRSDHREQATCQVAGVIRLGANVRSNRYVRQWLASGQITEPMPPADPPGGGPTSTKNVRGSTMWGQLWEQAFVVSCFSCDTNSMRYRIGGPDATGIKPSLFFPFVFKAL